MRPLEYQINLAFECEVLRQLLHSMVNRYYCSQLQSASIRNLPSLLLGNREVTRYRR